MINGLTTMSQAQKNSIEGFSRFTFAAVIADINITYTNLLRVIGAAVPPNVKRGDDYRLEAVEISKNIPVMVVVKKEANVDRANRIQGAFTKALSDMGFRTAASNAPYSVDVTLTISEVVLANQRNQFARYEIIANFIDTRTKQGLVSYNINGREGHTTLPEAENRAIAAAERKITEEYRDLLTERLSQMMPGK